MPDVWSGISDLDAATQLRLADILELRGADPQQQAMRTTFLDDILFAPDARVLELGCGTGVLTRRLARREGIAQVTGVDVAPFLLARARELAMGIPAVFRHADARALPFGSAEFDDAIFDSTLCHVPGAGKALEEAFRVLRPGGCLAAFDGDYATTTVALGDHDPLQACAAAMMAGSVHDRWLMRRLPAMLRARGFEVLRFRSHGYAEVTGAGYMLTIVDRGADMLQAAGELGPEAAASLKAEARRRVEAGTFFGHIAYAEVIARRPA
jgi:ubiquinone/menaquinone biosynthesis C-methylase UbiE